MKKNTNKGYNQGQRQHCIVLKKKILNFLLATKQCITAKKKEIKNTGKAQCNPFVEYYKYMYVY